MIFTGSWNLIQRGTTYLELPCSELNGSLLLIVEAATLINRPLMKRFPLKREGLDRAYDIWCVSGTCSVRSRRRLNFD